MHRYFYDSNGDILVRGTAAHDLAAAQARIAEVTDFIDLADTLKVKTDDGPYHRIVGGVPQLVSRLTEAERDEIAVIHQYRPRGAKRKFYKEIGHESEDIDGKLFPAVMFGRRYPEEIIFYGDEAKTVPVVKETNVWTHNALNIPVRKEKTIEHYDAQGQIIEGSATVKVTLFERNEGIEQSERGRQRVWHLLQDDVVNMMMLTEAPATVPEQLALLETGRGFLVALNPHATTWIQTAYETPLVDAITNATEAWIDNVVNQPEVGDTIRDYALWMIR